MVLPVPHPETIKLLDLSGYKTFFTDANEPFIRNHDKLGMKKFSIMSNGTRSATLPVYDIGGYKCSIAMNIADLRNVNDTVFKLSPGLDEVLSQFYSAEHWGFIICKLKAKSAVTTFFGDIFIGSSENIDKYHPFGYTHKMLDGQMMLPTRHFHGKYSEIAHDWDHDIFIYNGELIDSAHWNATNRCTIDFKKCSFEPDAFCTYRKHKIVGRAKNNDMWCNVKTCK